MFYGCEFSLSNSFIALFASIGVSMEIKNIRHYFWSNLHNTDLFALFGGGSEGRGQGAWKRVCGSSVHFSVFITSSNSLSIIRDEQGGWWWWWWRFNFFFFLIQKNTHGSHIIYFLSFCVQYDDPVSSGPPPFHSSSSASCSYFPSFNFQFIKECLLSLSSP